MTNFTRTILCFGALSLVGISPLRGEPAATAPATSPASQPDTRHPDTTKLTIRPSAVGRPALKYKLLPDLVDQTPGNAVTLYLLSREFWPDEKKRMELCYPENHRFDYQGTPIDQFPRQYSEAILAGFAKTLRYVDVGARRQDAVWDAGLRDGVIVRDIDTLVTYLHDMHSVANLLSFRATFQVSQGDWSAASYSLQTNFALARHVEKEPMLLHSLLASQFVEVAMHGGVEEWIAHGESPNLYWSLTNLPAPFVDLGQVARSFPIELHYWRPQLLRAMRGELPAEQWPQVLNEMVANLQKRRLPLKAEFSVEEQVKKLVESAYPRASKYLVAAGMAEKSVQTMSAEQTVGTYFCQEYNSAAEELWKAFTLPYWLAEPQMLSSWKSLAPYQIPLSENPLVQTELVEPPYWRGHNSEVLRWRWELVRSDRHIAMMRTIEAIRDYAAHHDSRLPERLDQITELPLPLNPITGKPFSYRLDGQTAILDAPAPEWRGVPSGLRYELTIGSGKK